MNNTMIFFYIFVALISTCFIFGKITAPTFSVIIIKLMSIVSLIISIYQLYLLFTYKITYF